MTNAAYRDSALGNKSTLLFKELGFRKLPESTSLGLEYYDITSFPGSEGQRIRRYFNEYEGSYANFFGGPNLGGGALGWLIAGAVREDDVPGISFFTRIPQDDPYPDPPTRVLNHFFDPIYNRPLTIAGSALGEKSPDWAFGTGDVFASQTQLNNISRNHFTLTDAHEAMYRALTLWKKDRLTGLYSEIDIGSSLAEDQLIERNRYWSTTFRALGDVVHLLQDMAQPQHTRNEPHNGLGPEVLQASITGHAAVIETYLEARATRQSRYTIDGLPLVPAPLTFTSGPIPEFDSYLEFWTTSQTDTAVTSRRGLADFSNREFLTNGHNAAPSYALPSIAQLSACERPVSALGYQLRGGLLIDSFKVLCGTVTDAYFPNTSASDVPLISQGALTLVHDDGSITAFPRESTYVLTKPNIDAMADNLLPRATAYSAGLLNRFFRGRLQISVPENKAYAVVDSALAEGRDPAIGGFYKLRAMVKNVTSSVNENGQSLPQDMQGGRLVAVVMFNENTCYKPDLTGEYGPANPAASCRNQAQEIVTSVTTRKADGTPVETVDLPAGGEPQLFEFDFALNHNGIIPINATDIYLQIVYRGKLGSEEDAVVVGTKDISEPTYYQVHNATDYVICVSNTWYRRNQDGSLSQAARDAILATGANPDDAFFQPRPIARATYSLQAPFVRFGSPLLEKLNLLPGQYIQYAFLTDAPSIDASDKTYTSAVSMDNFSFGPTTRPIGLYQLNFDDSGKPVSDFYVPTTTFRGERGTSITFAILNWPDSSSCDPVNLDDSNPTMPGIVPLSVIHDGTFGSP